ncbi:MAG TPA: efflux RND transporter periplasmic adaptor subunit [Myxococcales bacterium]|nr:efflux RND transporter periplasmic adaptor subunit [Myxococcales bacterium]
MTSSFFKNVRMPGRLSSSAASLLIGSFITFGCGSDAPPKKKIPEVVVAEVDQRDVKMHSDWIGTAVGFNNANIRPQVKGYLLEIAYTEGSVVKSGAVLFRIDPREFKAELDNAKGQLGEAKANLSKRRTHVARYTPLAKQGAISQQELDDAVQNELAAESQLLSAQARVEQARLNLGWTQITSPIDGVAGISATQIGDLVGPESHLTTVSQLDPIKVSFPITEKAYLDVVRNYGGKSGGNRLSQVGPILQLFLADGSLWPQRGTPFALGLNVDERTGTILVEGHFPNKNNVLRPGQFARVRVDTGTRKNALLVPQRAVNDIQGKYLISVVSSEDIVETRTVEVGETVNENWIITKGVKAGERVVVEGLQKVRSGVKVKPVSEGAMKKSDQSVGVQPELSPGSHELMPHLSEPSTS